uniref:G_PROTEIN_RECEP_F1_2 domain-containing protein n=1 Tax=Angiostrongylus cantonensis TaxID=6313 RepID=A0A0K0CU17_ANGCA
MAVTFVLSLTMRLTRKRAIYLSRRLYSYVVLVLQYIVPLTVLIITYAFIGMRMWNSRVPGSTDSTRKATSDRHESLILMVILISAMFAFCWLPLLLLINVVIELWPNVASSRYILYIWWFSHGLAMMHSMVNPIVYFLRNARFREGFCYFSRFLPCVHFSEFKLLSEHARRFVVC